MTGEAGSRSALKSSATATSPPIKREIIDLCDSDEDPDRQVKRENDRRRSGREASEVFGQDKKRAKRETIALCDSDEDSSRRVERQINHCRPDKRAFDSREHHQREPCRSATPKHER